MVPTELDRDVADPDDPDLPVAVPRPRPQPAADLRLALGRHRSGAGRDPRRHRLDPVRVPADPGRGPDPVADVGWVFWRGISKEAMAAIIGIVVNAYGIWAIEVLHFVSF